MTEGLTSTFTLGGQTFKYLNGGFDEEFVPGSVKQWDGSNWQRNEVSGKSQEKRFSISGILNSADGSTDDEQKQSMLALKDDTIYTDFTNGETSLTKAVIMDLRFSHAVNAPYGWNYTLVVEEFNQY